MKLKNMPILERSQSGRRPTFSTERAALVERITRGSQWIDYRHTESDLVPLTIPDLKTKIDLCLRYSRSNSDGVQNGRKVIRNDTVAHPVGPDGNDDNQEEPGPVLRIEVVGVSRLSVCLLGLETFNNLVVLESDQWIILNTIGMVFGQDAEGFFTLAIPYEPLMSRRSVLDRRGTVLEEVKALPLGTRAW